MTDFLLTPAPQDGKTCVAGLADREGVPQADNIDISRLKLDVPELTRAVTDGMHPRWPTQNDPALSPRYAPRFRSWHFTARCVPRNAR